MKNMHLDQKHIEIIFAFKPGFGKEILMVYPLIRDLLSAGKVVSLHSFHHYVYSEKMLQLRPLFENSLSYAFPDNLNVGICFFAQERSNGPYRLAALIEQASKRNWLMIDEDLEYLGPEENFYVRAEKIPKNLNLARGPDINIFYSGGTQIRKRYILVNLLGGSSSVKGIQNAKSFNIILESIGKAFPDITIVVPYLEYQVISGMNINNRDNLIFLLYDDDDRDFTSTVVNASFVITVEGGMLHLCALTRRPMCLLIREEWMNLVENMLPLGELRKIIYHSEQDDLQHILSCLIESVRF